MKKILIMYATYGTGHRSIARYVEEYFKSKNCEYINVDVFAYNELGINFYKKDGYHSRMQIMIKKI